MPALFGGKGFSQALTGKGLHKSSLKPISESIELEHRTAVPAFEDASPRASDRVIAHRLLGQGRNADQFDSDAFGNLAPVLDWLTADGDVADSKTAVPRYLDD